MTDQTNNRIDHNALRKALRERFLVFRECRPLALGCGNDIMAAAPDLGASERALRRWLHVWTTSNAYLRALATDGAVRYALDGTPGELVSEKHQAAALAEIKRRLALQAKNLEKPPAPAPTPTPPPVVAPGYRPAPIADALGRPILRLKCKAAP